ncbi:MAG: hypothetical protein JSS56_18275 [Proteobacteria bacterium]|nr:hypothetical protein [Pseudomonadota bacterium]
MTRRMLRRIGVLCAFVGIAFLAACASPADRTDMTPTAIEAARKFPYTLSVRTAGGNETSAMGSSEISNADLRAAIEGAVTRSSLFRQVVGDKSGDYELTVIVIQLTKPTFGGDFTVDMEATWTLLKTSDRSVAMRKSISSSHTATMNDAFVGVTRLRLAVEGAARDNIKSGLAQIAALNL